MKIDRIEIWTDVRAASGLHQANIPQDDLLKAISDQDIDGKHELNITLDRASVAWPSIQNERVFRVIYTDASIEEFRIKRPVEGREKSGAEKSTVKAHGILKDLANGIVARDEDDESISLFYTLLSLTRTDLVTLMVAAAPGHFTVGTITDGTTKVETFTFNYDSPLKALQELATLENLELAVRRNGDTDYLVDLITSVGSGSTEPEFRYRKNLNGVKRELDSSKMANRIYPAGGGDDAIRLGVADATWEVTAVPSSTEVDLGGAPIFEDDVLNNKFVEKSIGGFQQITDSDAALQRLTFGGAHSLSIGDTVIFRDNTTGKHLPYVESLIEQATYGLIIGTTEEPDLPTVDNLVDNAPLDVWSGGNPDDWNDVGSPTVTEENSALFTKVGGASARVVALIDEGIVSDAITISPVNPSIYFSAFVSIFVVSGEVEFFLTHSTEGRFPIVGADKLAVTSELDKFIQLSIETGEWPSGTVTLSIVARNGSATFYVDAAQLTNTGQNLAFFEGNAARKLWQRGLVSLAERSSPVVSYKIEGDDVFAIDPTNYPYDALTIGGSVLVEDEVLALQVTTRVLRLRRDLLESQTLGLGLSNLKDDLTDIISRRRRRVRQGAETRPSIASVENFIVSHKDDGTLVLQLFGSGGCRSFRYIADTSVMPTYGEVIASAGDGINSNVVDGTEISITEFRNTPGNPKLGNNNRAFVRIVAYPILNAGGVPGVTVTGTTAPTNFWSAEIIDTFENEDGSSPDIEVTRTWVVDTRTVAVRVYRKKDAWPTTNGLIDGPPDPEFDRGTVGGMGEEFAYKDAGYTTGDVVRDVAIAIDINGNQGERSNDSYTTTNTGTPQFVTAQRVQNDAGTNCSGDRRSVTVSWTTTGVTDGAHTVLVFRQVDGGVKVQIRDEDLPDTNESYQDNEAPMWGGGSMSRHVDYILELWNDAETTQFDSRTLQEDNPNGWNLCETPV